MDNEAIVTQTEKVLDYINTSLFTTIFIGFIFWWIFKNSRSKSKIFPLFLFLVYILSGAISDWILIFLSSKFEVDKATIEKVGFYEGSYKEELLYNVDIVKVYNFLLMTAQILKISVLFLAVANWIPYTGGSAFARASTATLARYYAILRIPIVVSLMHFKDYIPYSTLAFIRMFYFGTEIGTCSLFFIILKTRYQGALERENQKGRYGGINVLILLLQFDAFFNYMVYTMSIPLPLNEITTYVVEKLGFIANLLVNIILLTILKPQWTYVKEEDRKNELLCLSDLKVEEVE